MKGTLKSLQNSLRTATVEGVCVDVIKVGKTFKMQAPSLSPEASIRLIETTPIQTIKQLDEQTVEFTTLSGSTYQFIKQSEETSDVA